MDGGWFTLVELIRLDQMGRLRTGVVNFDQSNVRTQQVQASFQNVHQYDGTLINPVQISYNPDIKRVLLQQLLMILRNPVSRLMAEKILLENTVDRANQVSTSDLLADILVRRMTPDIFLLLEEQLADNWMLGQCPQGQSTRLLQIRNMLA